MSNPDEKAWWWPGYPSKQGLGKGDDEKKDVWETNDEKQLTPGRSVVLGL